MPGWLVGCLKGWSVGELAYWLVVGLFGRLLGWSELDSRLFAEIVNRSACWSLTSSEDWSLGQLVGLLVSVGRLVGLSVYWLVSCLVSRLVGQLVYQLFDGPGRQLVSWSIGMSIRQPRGEKSCGTVPLRVITIMPFLYFILYFFLLFNKPP